MAMLVYSVASAGMMIVNKMCMRRAALPSFFSTVQFSMTVLTVQTLGRIPCDTSCPRSDVHLRWARFRPYLQHAVLFVACIYCNMQALRHTSIETIIVFRASTPLVVSVLDRAFLGRDWLSLRSLLALLVLVISAAGYVLSDHAFQMNGFAAYTWVALYFATISLEMAYAKHIIGSVEFDSMWGAVFHNNLAAIPMMMILGLSAGEQQVLVTTTWDGQLLSRLALSCAVSVCIAYAGWNCRNLVSASCFTVLGVSNKILTVLINNLIWKNSASLLGSLCLFVCLVAAVCYQQAPMRASPSGRTLADGVTLVATRRSAGTVLAAGTTLALVGTARAAEAETPSGARVVDCREGSIPRDADGPPPCHRQARPSSYVSAPAFSAVVQTFKDGPSNAMQLVQRLRSIPLSKDIIVNDDSHGKQSAIWLALLTGANEFYVSSPNLHEVRAYNRLAHYARGELLVFVQGDCCLPSSPQWMMDASQLFRALPNLAMLSARAGFETVLTAGMSEDQRSNFTRGSAPHLPLDRAMPSDGNPSKSIPFNFVPGVDNGPLIYRRAALHRVGGFDETYSCRAGHVAVHYDFEVAIRFWTSGWEVGVYYGAPSNGLGGRKSMRKLPMRVERHINEEWNAKRTQRLLATHYATIVRRIAESTRQHLLPIPADRREAARTSREEALGKLPNDERCFAGIDLEVLTRGPTSGSSPARARPRGLKKQLRGLKKPA